MTLLSQLVGTLAKMPPARTHDVGVERDLTQKMPDGATLLADRWYPRNPARGAPPVVLLRSPYGRRQLSILGRLYAERGYQVVIQSCRGTFGSDGDFVPFRHEGVDGRATLEWVAAQPWFDGRLFTFGPSYLGLTQWAIAEDAPDFVKGMALTVTSSNFRHAIVYPGGSFGLESLLCWIHQTAHQEERWWRVLGAQVATAKVVRAAAAISPLEGGDRSAVGRRHDFFQDCLAHEAPDDTWWDLVTYGHDLSAVPPATLVGGWYDLFLPAQVADFEALRAAGRPARLTVGPWTHASLPGMAAAMRDGLEWFDQQVAAPSARRPRAAVRLFVMGSDQWRDFEEWPPPADRQTWYLGGGGTLGPEAPGEAAGDAPDRYRYDPADPTPSRGGPALLAKNAGPRDQRPRESRADVLTYTSAVMAHDVTVVGPLTATLYLRSSLEHTDFFVRLCDVSPKGKSTNVSDGIVRLTPGAVTAGEDGTFKLEIAMWPTAQTFKAGHRIRLQVSSGAHPLFARNPGSGERLGTAATLRPADQEVFHDARRPSCLVLPVVAR
ncbi:MAG TPA: CocE/NonD family hydrolase [Acidimicrobiales bacterium]|jgi:hypothetical protein